MTQSIAIRAAEPGARMPAPDPELHLLQDFVNTIDIEGAEDELATPDATSAWLAARGLTSGRADVSRADHGRLLTIREGLRALGAANDGDPLEDDERAAFNAAVASVSMVGAIDASGAWRLASPASAVDDALARLLGTLGRAIADGSWARMKACHSHSCRWLFWDASRNRSGTWCTMAICGSRQKSRSYRARQRTPA